MNKIVTIKDGKVVADINVLTIPELKVLYEKFEGEDRDLLFQGLYHLFDIDSPYQNLPEDEREDIVWGDFKGKFKPKFDKDIIAAKDKLHKLSWNSAKDLLEGLKINVKNISMFLKTVEVNAGKDGNLTQLISAQKAVKDMIKNLNATEQEYLKENAKNRGNYKKAIDEEEEY